nr:hypothetical protein [Tanacetum cinerariifolium]
MESLNSNFQERERAASVTTNARQCKGKLHGLMIRKYFIAYTQTNVPLFHATLIQHMESLKESILERAKHKREKDRRVNDRMIQSKKRKDNSSKALDVGLVVTESNETESERHVLSSRSRNDMHTDDADINFVNDKQPMAKVQLSVEHNILANKQQHSEQSESVYDTYLLEKTVENADLKAQIQEKVFANATLKNELRKSKGNSVDTKFAKPSILGKPVLEPPRNQSVVRQPNAFKSKRPNFSKPRESDPAKPHHVNVPSSFRNSKKELYSSKDMAHNYYLEEAKKKTQEKNRNLKPREMPFAKTHHTPNACAPKPRSNNQTSRNWPASKSCEETLKAVQKADRSRNPSSFLDFKHFVCSTCQKCVFNANHDACITKFLKEVNSRAKIQPNKTRNSNKPVDPTSHTQKPGRKIATVHRFSPNKSSPVHEKTNTPGSCLRWIPMGRIFNTAGLKWVPTRKTFTSNTTKVDCEPPNGSNDYITNPYKCDQTLNVSAGTRNLNAGALFQSHGGRDISLDTMHHLSPQREVLGV